MTLSLCMIVKNEEAVLARCLSSVKSLFDEIIIVDTGSSDSTKSIAYQFTDKVFDFKWIDDFSAARNFSFSKATMQYIMWLDADDVIEPAELSKLNKLKQNAKGDADVYMLKYSMSFDENNNPAFFYFRERIVKNDKSFIWLDPVHEVMAPHGRIEYSDISISHKKIKTERSDRNLRIYQKLLEQNKKLSARQKFYYARELMFNNLTDDAIKAFDEFLNDKTGWIENKIEACKNMAECFVKKNDFENAKRALFFSFGYDLPRAEIVCEIGNIFLQEKNYINAIFWYKSALSCKAELKNGAFVQKDYYDFFPYLQLCVCYFHIKDITASKYYNNLAAKLKPNHPSVKLNNNFFKNLKTKK